MEFRNFIKTIKNTLFSFVQIEKGSEKLNPVREEIDSFVKWVRKETDIAEYKDFPEFYAKRMSRPPAMIVRMHLPRFVGFVGSKRVVAGLIDELEDACYVFNDTVIAVRWIDPPLNRSKELLNSAAQFVNRNRESIL